MTTLAGKKIVLGVSGGIAAYKAPELVRRLRDRGAEVRVALTEAANAFITPLSLQAVSGYPVSDSLLDPAASSHGGDAGAVAEGTAFHPTHKKGKIRLWNHQLIRYAGYVTEDGTIIGDPASVDFTSVCQELGWKGQGSAFDVLPLVIQLGENPKTIFNFGICS